MRLAILAFAAGVIALQVQPELPVAWPWAFAGLAGAALAVIPVSTAGLRRVFRGIGIFACVALGFAWAAWRADVRLADELPSAWEGRDVEVSGIIAGLPQDFANGTRFEFAVETVSTAAAHVPARIMLSWYQGSRDGEDFVRQSVRPGERWRFTVRLKRPHGNANPHGFDYEAWLLERGIRATGYVRPAPAIRLAPMVWRPDYIVERVRDWVRASFLAALPPESHPWGGILVALAVGDQKAVSGDLWTVFNRTGTTHLMSIEYSFGAHVVRACKSSGGCFGIVF
jgi:competence protein ComEC